MEKIPNYKNKLQTNLQPPIIKRPISVLCSRYVSFMSIRSKNGFTLLKLVEGESAIDLWI